MIKYFFRYIGYRMFCIVFFIFFWLLFYILLSWLILGRGHEWLNIATTISAAAAYIAYGTERRREFYGELSSDMKSSTGFFWFRVSFHIVVFFCVWAGLCVLLNMFDSTLWRSIHIGFSITEAYGYKWLLIPAFLIEWKYRYDRADIIRKIWSKYRQRKNS